jgi:hypothetical protein
MTKKFQRLATFVDFLRQGLNPSAAARRLGYRAGNSAWANASKLAKDARAIGLLGPDNKPVPVSQRAALAPLPPDERRRLATFDAETARRERLAKFLSVPLAEIPELERVGMPEWWTQDKLGPFRGTAPPWPERLPLCMTYCDAEERAAWRAKREMKNAGWTRVYPILENQTR